MKQKRICYDIVDIKNAMLHIETIMISLVDIARYYYNQPCDISPSQRKKYEKETTEFIDKSLVTSRLAEVRLILASKMLPPLDPETFDEMIDEDGEPIYWKKPGDFIPYEKK